ncbi:Uncharacterized protein GBIM_17874, partial [Gryllus bimaculatus]
YGYIRLVGASPIAGHCPSLLESVLALRNLPGWVSSGAEMASAIFILCIYSSLALRKQVAIHMMGVLIQHTLHCHASKNLRNKCSQHQGMEILDIHNQVNIKRRHHSQVGVDRRVHLREINHEIEDQESNSIIPHTWLGHGHLLRLMDPTHCGNYVLFQRVWKNEYPLIISHIHEKLNKKLWNPNSFSQDFGDEKIPIINCRTGEIILEQPTKYFWNGFENLCKRPKDEEGLSMLLKIKQWPLCTNFQSHLPFHMNDLLEAMPLSAYTHPNGLLNFVNYLPIGFLNVDLRTELQCAYGISDHLSVGTKKLDIKIVDIVNILVYVGQSRNGENDYEHNEVLQAIRDAGCDQKSLERVKKDGDNPGAIWHVYNVRDKNKINDFLRKVSFERGILSQPHEDFVHGEKWYLDRNLRQCLQREYNIKVHTILQCHGDAVIIPAGAPHQVCNIKSCIMVNHDFISLQNIKKF